MCDRVSGALWWLAGGLHSTVAFTAGCRHCPEERGIFSRDLELVPFQWLPRLSLSSGRPNLLLLVSPWGSQSAVLSQVWPFSFK